VKKARTGFIKIALRISSTLHSTRVAIWYGFAIGSWTDLRSV